MVRITNLCIVSVCVQMYRVCLHLLWPRVIPRSTITSLTMSCCVCGYVSEWVSGWVHIRLCGGGASWTGADNVPSFWPTVCQAVGQHTSVAAATLTNKRRQQIIFTEPTLGSCRHNTMNRYSQVSVTYVQLPIDQIKLGGKLLVYN